jgi:hypothetical protein
MRLLPHGVRVGIRAEKGKREKSKEPFLLSLEPPEIPRGICGSFQWGLGSGEGEDKAF